MSPPTLLPKRNVTAWGLVDSAGFLGAAATLAAFLGNWSWLLELTTHFKVQLAVSLGLLAAVSGVGRRWKPTALLAAATLVNAVPAVWEARPRGPEPPVDAQPLRLMSLNVHTANTRSDRVLACIRDIQPDVVLLMEVNSRWMEELKPLRTEYPNAVIDDREDNFGIALFSRVPLIDSQTLDLADVGVPSIEATLQWQGIRVGLLGTHPVPPGGAGNSADRNRQLEAIGNWSRERQGPLVVLGDLNCTPWSPAFRPLTDSGRLQLCRPRWGLQPSWPARQPLLGIPIDHCLTSPEVAVLRRHLGPDVGSDHFPLWVELALPGATRP